MIYEVEAVLTFQRESIAKIVGVSVDKRALGASAHTLIGNICFINIFFTEKVQAEEFIDWLFTLSKYLDFYRNSENYCLLKKTDLIIDGQQLISV